MNFTREPIIETVVVPKDGYKLLVKNSHKVNQEEFLVYALEIVSFGVGCFFRSLDRSKPFLLPVTFYEVIEVKEARTVVKKPLVVGKSIKIGGNRSIGEHKEGNKGGECVSEKGILGNKSVDDLMYEFVLGK